MPIQGHCPPDNPNWSTGWINIPTGEASPSSTTKTKTTISKKRNPNGVTKSKSRKRGWPKGKPRKDVKPFPFLRLPLELRRHIYEMVLPHGDVPLRSGKWANMVGGDSNQYMNLLVTNKQISDEARQVLYGKNNFTMVIAHDGTWRQGSFYDGTYRPTGPTPSLPYIKNWQLNIQSLTMLHMKVDFRMKEALLTAAAEMSSIPDMHSLKVSIPCYCEHVNCDCEQCSQGPSWYDREDIDEILVNTLAPLNHLRFQGDVQLRTVPDTRLMERPPVGLEQRRNCYSPLACSTKNEQCQRPACLEFAASLATIPALVGGNTTALGFTAPQTKYLELKQRLALMDKDPFSSSSVEMRILLHEAWKALESGDEQYFGFVYRSAMHVMEPLHPLPYGFLPPTW